ncbi:hypothetical protein SAMN04488038_106181 [Solimonas aquatica]|uniref:EthD domain-containing protein n=1 Tax=Solimonas aquatica TaxID=489703 RepID=A0A1H9G135_9GAMM|nr:DUF4286 family protein [Solimonas aquatica]SEQ43875.1 hypothetical protein SAMN04488038_106181 [Solimonas aquatica]
MAQYRMVVLSAPVPGREAEYNHWYQQVHLPEVLRLPGFVAAQRLRLAHNLVEASAHPYAAIYELETEDLPGLLQQLRDAAAGGGLQMSEAIDTAGVIASVYEVCGPRLQA